MQEQHQQQYQIINRIMGFHFDSQDFGRLQGLGGQLGIVSPNQLELEDAFNQHNGLRIGNKCDPESLCGTWQRQGAPEEDHYGQRQRNDAGIDHLKQEMNEIN